MSARKAPESSLPAPVTIQNQATQIDLPANAVQIRKNGIEFRTLNPLALFTEVSIAIQSAGSSKKVQCHGVVVACNGNRHQGYHASVLFLDTSPALQQRLASLSATR